MVDENDRDPEEQPEEEQPEEKQPEEVEEQLSKATGTKASEAIKWLARLMPAKKIGNLRLDGVLNLDPTKKKSYDEYLKRPEYKPARERLASRLASWIDVLETSDDTTQASDALEGQIDSLNAVFEKNQSAALEAVRPLEKSYRMLDAFFANAQKETGDKVDCWVYNATGESLMDTDDRANFETLAARMQEEFRSFSMRKNYGLLVVPGWLRDVKQLDRLGELGYQNKFLAITDGPDLDSADELLEVITDDVYAGMMGPDPKKRNIALYCNYLVARTKNDKVEEEDFYVPPSMHVAGAIYRGDLTYGIHQSIGGFFHGKLKNAVDAKFKVDRPKATRLMAKHGLNAVVGWDGYPVVVGDGNLCTEEGRNTYAKIRTEDWICKNVLNFLNYQAFQANNSKNRTTWKAAIYKFLDSICDRTGRKIIKGFKVDVISSDEDERKNIVNVALRIDYQTSVRYFNLRMRDRDGRKEAELEDNA